MLKKQAEATSALGCCCTRELAGTFCQKLHLHLHQDVYIQVAGSSLLEQLLLQEQKDISLGGDEVFFFFLLTSF